MKQDKVVLCKPNGHSFVQVAEPSPYVRGQTGVLIRPRFICTKCGKVVVLP